MKQTMNPDVAAKWKAAETELEGRYVSFRDSVLSVLADFKVREKQPEASEKRAMTNRTKWFVIVSDDPRLVGWSEEFCFQVKREHSFSSDLNVGPGKLTLMRKLPFLSNSDRAKTRRYTHLDGKTYSKILKDMQENMEGFIEVKINNDALAAKRREWVEIKRKAMDGMPMPPGMRVLISQSSDPKDPRFGIENVRDWLSLKTAQLTADQVKKILAVVNEVMGTDDIYLIAVRDPEHNEWWFWEDTHLAWCRYSQCGQFGKMYRSRAAAEAEIEKARGGCRWKLAGEIQVISWKDIWSENPKELSAYDYMQ